MNASTQPPTKTKKAKAPKNEAKAETEANGAEAAAPKEAKPRGPRKDYGFAPTSVIKLTDGEKSYRGQRLEWYNHLKAHDGQTVAQFLEGTKDMKDPARGWLRFFVQDEACTLTTVEGEVQSGTGEGATPPASDPVVNAGDNTASV